MYILIKVKEVEQTNLLGAVKACQRKKSNNLNLPGRMDSLGRKKVAGEDGVWFCSTHSREWEK